MSKLQSFFMNNRIVFLIFVSIIIVYGISWYERQAEYWYWMENQQEYVVDNVIGMTGADSYYWLRMAKELDMGTIGRGEVNPLKGYPDGVKFAIKDRASLLAHLISLTKNFTGGDYYKAGLLLIPILASLFIFPLFFYFNRLGFGASAILGGLLGTFSIAYYDRTEMGRVDTDLLNIFFLLTAACFILVMSREKTWRFNICMAIGAGLTMYLFTWWYQTPIFILVFLFTMAVHLLFARIHWQQIIAILIVFLLFSGPDHVLQTVDSLKLVLKAYVSPATPGPVTWPNIMETIAEVQNRGITFKLKILGFLPLVIAGFAGLIPLYFLRLRQMIAITPLIMLGIWSMVGPNRFVMYMAPFIGIGAGVLLELLINFTAQKIRVKPLPVSLVTVSLMFILFFSTSAYTKFGDHHSRPIILASTTRALLDIKKVVPKHSAMFTPFWGASYALMDIGEFATYHDGGVHGGMRTTLISRAMTSASQQEMVSLISYLEDNGFNGLASRIRKENLSAAQMLELVFAYPGDFKGENVYILYLINNIEKIFSMSHFGTWDFEQRKSKRMEYVWLECSKPVNNIMQCSDGTIDLNRGFMNDGTVDIPLRAVVFVNNGYVIDAKTYSADKGYYLQILMKNNTINTILVAEERLFITNFNQQYILGNYDRRYFEEVYNDFPLARVLKVKKSKE